MRYQPGEIEPRWQAYWDQHKVFAAPEKPSGTKRYVLDMFPYPSGEGLHVGHPEGYTATDIISRFARMNGESVLHPMGFDAFGLPAEEHAIKTGEHPRIQTQRNIDNFTRQLKMLGFSYDWDRVLSTTDETYFKWTQFIFLVLHDTWVDPQTKLGRPISELPIPDAVQSAGRIAIEKYRDSKRLAYQDDALVNWCEGLGTVLANEEVIDGKSERGGHPVRRIPLRQWMLRITDYADRLLADLDDLDWSPGIKKLQSDWIGKSTGAEVDFYVGEPADFDAWSATRKKKGFPDAGDDQSLRVYTTRPDTLFGATYMVIAPEHPWVDRLTTPARKDAVDAYVQKASFKSDRERTEGDREKTGVDSGATAINPVTGKAIPIWIADYVLAGYGTGAIMAVPAHDARDFEFAQAFDLPIVPVVDPPADDDQRDAILAGQACYVATGIAINSDRYDGMTTEDVKSQLVDELSGRGVAGRAVNYKLRDWLFSRQRFWGEPFPILHELDSQGTPTGVLRAVPVEDLPVKLPELEDFKPHGKPEPPLGKADDDWLYVELDGKRYRRETNTMPQWAGSCWYYLRYIDPHNETALVDPELEKQWMPVDLYVGGAEHAVLHLLYARFWHKVLHDRGYVSTAEPFQRLVNQGMILGEAVFTGFVDDAGNPVTSKGIRRNEDRHFATQQGQVVSEVVLQADQVEKRGGQHVLVADPKIRVESKAQKMSKSRGNVIKPDDVVRDYGADSLRLYEMFMGPLEATKPWSMTGVGGVRSFLDRVWRLIIDGDSDEERLSPAVTDETDDDESLRVLHQTIKKVTEDTRAMSFNTAIARMMEFTNHFTRQNKRSRESLLTFLKLLSPYAPHIADELASKLGYEGTLATATWPQHDAKWLVRSTLELPVQVNGKVKSKIQVPADADQESVLEIALADDKIAGLAEGKNVIKKILVPGRLVNLVIK
ncbi:MAG: leucine--tRNA ligase [Planctomycetota bacterium]